VDAFQKTRQLAVSLLLLVSAVVLSTTATRVLALESLFGDGPEPLPVEEAFAPELSNVSADQLQISFTIADGYYLYQKKMSFESDDSAVILGAPVFGKALIQEDDYFGKSKVFRDTTSMSVPLTNTSAKSEFVIAVGFQGCADMGLCYPPTKTEFKVALPAQTALATNDSDKDAATSTTASTASATATESTASPAPNTDIAAPAALDLNDLLKNKSGSGTNESDTLLHPSQAFVPSVINAGDGQIGIRWFIEPGYYLYRDKIDFAVVDAGEASVADFDVDRGVIQNDEFFGDVEVLREVASARINLNKSESLSSATLQIESQGCADIGVCFPPETTSIPVTFTNTGSTDVVAALTDNNTKTDPIAVESAAITDTSTTQSSTQRSAADNNSDSVSPTSNTESALVTTAASTNSNAKTALPVTEQDKLTRLLEGGHLGFIAFAFYVAGLLLAFTACMYPMIPILSSLIVGQGNKLSTTKAFSLSLVYVLSMASVFAVVGVLVGLSGFNIQPLFQNPWVLSAFAGLFVLLALSMFGLFQLQMPSAIQSKVSEISNKQEGGSFTGVAVMGMLSALIVGPCVTPPLVAALAYIAKTGDATIGGIALFAIGIGMGTPLLFIGTSLGRFMPKAGGWMETTQRIFGVILLAVAIYLVSRFLPGSVIMFLAAMLAIFTGVYFGATDRLDSASGGTQRFGKSVGLVALVYGIVLMIGALAGNTSMLSPLKGVVGQQIASSGASTDDEHVSFKRIKSLADLDNELMAAKAQNQPVMLDFYADWCVSCKEMEAFTFPDSRVKEQLADALLIQADVTRNDEDDKALLKEFGLFGPPAIILYDREGVELTAGRVVGYMKAEPFSQHLQAYLNQ